MNSSSAVPDNRHIKRLRRLEAVFAWPFYADKNITATETAEQFASIQEIIDRLEEIDKVIFQYAPKHGLETFNKMDLAILRQALYELLYTDTPPAVVINEAVEIAKQYGSEETPSFIHGVLGSAADNMKKELNATDPHSPQQAE